VLEERRRKDVHLILFSDALFIGAPSVLSRSLLLVLDLNVCFIRRKECNF
jgi:hypothetical protein